MTNDFRLYKLNIFLAIEAFLADPSIENESIIKALSSSLINSALTKTIYTHKKSIDEISADEWQPCLLELVEEQAQVAKLFSARMYEHDIDPLKDNLNDYSTIFKLSKDEFNKIIQVKSKLLNEGVADGLIFTFGGYIERLESTNTPYYLTPDQAMSLNFNAKFLCDARRNETTAKLKTIKKETDAIKDFLSSPLDEMDSKIEGHMILLMKACLQLEKDGYLSLGNKIRQSIHQLQYDRATEKDPLELSQKMHTILQSLSNDDDIVHHMRLKAVILNFLICISLVGLIPLAATAYQRGSFFYQPENEIRNVVDAFDASVDNDEQKSLKFMG